MLAFSRPGDEQAQSFARELGAEWAGGIDAEPPEELDAAIVFAPVGTCRSLSPDRARRHGRLCGIHMTDIPSFPYELLWNERSVRSIANLTRRDVRSS